MTNWTNLNYEKYEEELIPYFIDQYDVDFLVDLFKESLLGGELTIYKNNVVWAFIETVAFQAVEEHNFEYAQANADALAPAKMLDEWNNSFELYQPSPV